MFGLNATTDIDSSAKGESRVGSVPVYETNLLFLLQITIFHLHYKLSHL